MSVVPWGVFTYPAMSLSSASSEPYSCTPYGGRSIWSPLKRTKNLSPDCARFGFYRLFFGFSFTWSFRAERGIPQSSPIFRGRQDFRVRRFHSSRAVHSGPPNAAASDRRTSGRSELAPSVVGRDNVSRAAWPKNFVWVLAVGTGDILLYLFRTVCRPLNLDSSMAVRTLNHFLHHYSPACS
jgi:hypothetical protein